MLTVGMTPDLLGMTYNYAKKKKDYEACKNILALLFIDSYIS